MKILPKILFIDDDQDIRETFENLLAGEALELLFAEDGETGINLAQTFQPDAIWLDVMMPGLDGYETCRKLRAISSLSEIPIIIMTALDDRQARLTGLEAGADEFLTKPFDGLEIRIRVKNILRLNRYRNLVAERSRFYWVIENAEKGYLLLDESGKIQYANHRAQIFFHLPEAYLNLDFSEQAALYYETHFFETDEADPGPCCVSFLVQPESASARAFWLRVEGSTPEFEVGNQRLLSVTDITNEMVNHQDIRKINLLVAHKLRTPVALIYSSMTLLDSKMEVIPPEEVKSLVKTAWKGAERLVTEVRDILQYVDAPLALAKGEAVCLNEMEKMAATAGEFLGLNQVTLSLPAQLAKCQLRISTGAMELIIHELLQNSKKFHPSQTPQVQIRVEALSAAQIQIQFLDDGQAMTAEQITWAKQPYSQGEKFFTGEMPGMGLGLSAVTTLVWQSGGQVRITNRADRVGICVSLILAVLKECGASKGE